VPPAAPSGSDRSVAPAPQTKVTEPVRIVRADNEGERVAAEWLCGGGIAVVPTDTVYGLAARPTDANAVRSVYRVKGRPEGMHLPVLAASVAQVRALGVTFTPGAEALARRWWPGPLTLAFGFAPHLARPDWLDGRAEVAVRIPDHDFLRALLERTGVLVVTSANAHGAPTPRTAHDVAAGLGSAVDLVVDGGELHDVPSTLVNVNGPETSVERVGALSRAAVADALQEAR
jgi:L-threonylcarbamoyladenylate synthase